MGRALEGRRRSLIGCWGRKNFFCGASVFLRKFEFSRLSHGWARPNANSSLHIAVASGPSNHAEINCAAALPIRTDTSEADRWGPCGCNAATITLNRGIQEFPALDLWQRPPDRRSRGTRGLGAGPVEDPFEGSSDRLVLGGRVFAAVMGTWLQAWASRLAPGI